jgi:hypothetical protein
MRRIHKSDLIIRKSKNSKVEYQNPRISIITSGVRHQAQPTVADRKNEFSAPDARASLHFCLGKLCPVSGFEIIKQIFYFPCAENIRVKIGVHIRREDYIHFAFCELNVSA